MKANFEIYRLLAVSLILAGVLPGCEKKVFNDIEAFQSYVTRSESPFQIKEQKGDVQFTLQYLPTELVMKTGYKELENAKDRKNKAGDQGTPVKQLVEDLETQRSHFSKNLYFKLTIGFSDQNRDLVYSKGGSYSDWLQKLLFSMDEYLEMETTELEEVTLLHYRMERTYGMTSSRTFLLVFPKAFNDKKVLDAEKITIKLEEFGLGTGPIHFSFELPFPKISYTPNLKM